MKQMITAVISAAMLLSFQACESVPQGKNDTTAAHQISYEKAAALWAKAGAVHYTLKIEFGAFSPNAGIWDIEVKNGTAVHWTFKNVSDGKQYETFAAGLTMEKLFERAKSAGPAQPDKPFKLEIAFDSASGYVKSITKVRNPAHKKTIPTDQTYLYVVREMKILESKGGASK